MKTGPTERTRRLSRLVDITQLAIVAFAGVAIALDLTGVIELPWLKSNLLELTFIAVCALIVASALERQVTLNALEAQLRLVVGQIDVLEEGLAGRVSADLLFRDRKGYTRPLEVRLADAKDVTLSGVSLVGIVTHYVTLFRKLAQHGCNFRFLLPDPTIVDVYFERANLEAALERLVSFKKDFPARVEIRLVGRPVVYSVLMIDHEAESGEVQIEFYTYGSITSERPHITLTRTQSPQWYQFFVQDFEAAWTVSRPCDVKQPLQS